MKLIEAMKQVKDLLRKAEDLRKKVQANSAYLSYETPPYPDTKRQIKEWLQAHADILKEVLKLREAIQRTNLATIVEIELGGKRVSKSIAAWIHRRRDLAALDREAWACLTDRGLKEGQLRPSTGDPIEVKIVRNFDAAERDASIEAFMQEPSLIDARLEIVNAVTDLLE